MTAGTLPPLEYVPVHLYKPISWDGSGGSSVVSLRVSDIILSDLRELVGVLIKGTVVTVIFHDVGDWVYKVT